MLRFLTSGESHGPMLLSILDGMPAGLAIDLDEINREMARRQQGYGRGARQKIETDTADFTGGVRHGITSGAPLGIVVRNRDWENWQHVMAAAAVDDKLPDVKAQLEKKAIGNFRPGHADLAGSLKFRQRDIRDVLERASARETAARVAIGAVCRQLLRTLEIRCIGHVTGIGSIDSSPCSEQLEFDELERRVLASDMFCADEQAAEKMKEQIKAAWQEGDSLGGVVEVVCDGLPVGLGSYTQWDEKLDGQLAQAIMSVQAIKAVEIGDGVKNSRRPGSTVHDALFPANANSGLPFSRQTNRAGGVEGGMSNGSRLVVRGYMKPIPTLRKGLPSLSFPGFAASVAHYERSDVCAVPAASVVCQSMVCFILARSLLQKFGGDTISDTRLALEEYRSYCRQLKTACKDPPAASQPPEMELE